MFIVLRSCRSQEPFKLEGTCPASACCSRDQQTKKLPFEPEESWPTNVILLLHAIKHDVLPFLRENRGHMWTLPLQNAFVLSHFHFPLGNCCELGSAFQTQMGGACFYLKRSHSQMNQFSVLRLLCASQRQHGCFWAMTGVVQ